jgi:DNA-directed RNA polymerase subunit RPC12/RpoP
MDKSVIEEREYVKGTSSAAQSEVVCSRCGAKIVSKEKTLVSTVKAGPSELCESDVFDIYI